MNTLLYTKGAFPCYEKSLSFIQGNATIELYYYVLTSLCQLSYPFKKAWRHLIGLTPVRYQGLCFQSRTPLYHASHPR